MNSEFPPFGIAGLVLSAVDIVVRREAARCVRARPLPPGVAMARSHRRRCMRLLWRWVGGGSSLQLCPRRLRRGSAFLADGAPRPGRHAPEHCRTWRGHAKQRARAPAHVPPPRPPPPLAGGRRSHLGLPPLPSGARRCGGPPVAPGPPPRARRYGPRSDLLRGRKCKSFMAVSPREINHVMFFRCPKVDVRATESVEATQWVHANTWTVGGMLRAAFGGVGQSSRDVRGEADVQDTRRGLQAMMSVSGVVSKLFSRAHHAFRGRLQQASAIVVNRFHDSTPLLLRFGRLEAQLCVHARYLRQIEPPQGSGTMPRFRGPPGYYRALSSCVRLLSLRAMCARSSGFWAWAAHRSERHLDIYVNEHPLFGVVTLRCWFGVWHERAWRFPKLSLRTTDVQPTARIDRDRAYSGRCHEVGDRLLRGA